MSVFCAVAITLLLASISARAQQYNWSNFAGTPGASGTANGIGNATLFNEPGGVAIDTSGNIYVADTYNHTIRKVTNAGVVTTLAGSPGISGTADGTGGAANFFRPGAVAVDTSGNVYVADSGNCTIRKVTSGGVVTTLAGSAGTSGSADGVGTAAQFAYPQGIALDASGNIYVADTGNCTIRKITNGTVITLAGSPGTPGTANGTGTAAQFSYCRGVAVDGGGNIYVGDYKNNVIRKVTPSGTVTTLAGSLGTSGTAGNQLGWPCGVAVDGSGNVYVADVYYHTIRKASGSSITTLAGSPGVSGIADATGTAAGFTWPQGVAVDGNGNVYVADSGNHTIRKVTSTGVVATLAGSPGSSGSGDTGINNGTGVAARFNWPRGVIVDGSGIVYVADTQNSTIRKVTTSGTVTTLAGSPGTTGTINGTGSAARFGWPYGIVISGTTTLYVADTNNSAIRKLTTTGTATTLAGMPGLSGTANGTGTAALFNSVPSHIVAGQRG